MSKWIMFVSKTRIVQGKTSFVFLLHGSSVSSRNYSWHLMEKIYVDDKGFSVIGGLLVSLEDGEHS